MAVVLATETDDSVNAATYYTFGYDNLYIVGNTFTGVSNYLDSVNFRLNNTNTPTTGTLEAVLFDNITGTVGSNGVPSSTTPIAVSESLALPSGLPSGTQTITFNFVDDNRVLFDSSTNYAIALRYTHPDYTEYMSFQVHGGTTSHSGNYFGKKTNASFSAIGSVDLYFELYVDTSPPASSANGGAFLPFFM